MTSESKIKYLTTDVETSGIGPETELLTLYMGIFSEQFELLDELDLKILPRDVDSGSGKPLYRMTPEAMAVNKIDLLEHSKVAIPRTVAADQIGRFLYLNAIAANIKGLSKEHKGGPRPESSALILTPLGHNVKFDLDKLRDIAPKSINAHVSYRVRDTSVVAGTLKDAGMYREDQSTSVTALASLHGLPPFEAHTAKGDALTTLGIYRAQLKTIISGRIENAV